MYTAIPASFSVSHELFNEHTGEEVTAGDVTITQDTSSGVLTYRFASTQEGGPRSIGQHEVEAMYVEHMCAEIAQTKVLVSDDTFSACRGIFVLHFGAYGCTHVLAFGSLEDALENAADILPGGLFTDVDYESARAEMYESGDLSEEQYNDRDSDEVSDMVHERATVDLTYTESGYIASHEWGCTAFENLADALTFAQGL